MKISAIIFDMDGVLVDTEPLMFDVFRSVFSPFGIYLSDEYQYRFIGKPFAENLADIRRDFGIDFNDEQIHRGFFHAYREMLKGYPLQPQAGITTIIEKGKERGCRFAVCTTTSRPQVEIVLARLAAGGALDPATTFHTIVTGNDVTHKKPHPAPYLAAAQRLGLPPEECLAIEDTETGVASAKAAGCLTIALRQPYNADNDLSLADHVVNHLAEAAAMLDDILRQPNAQG